MACLTAWSIACLAVVPPLALIAGAGIRGGAAMRMAALQLATSVVTILLVLLTFYFDQSSFVDIALGLALLSLPGTFGLALFLERWV